MYIHCFGEHYHRKQGEYLQDYPLLPLGEAPGSRRSNLAHPNIAIFSHSTQTEGLNVAYQLPYL